MENLVLFFEDLSNPQKLIWIIICLSFFWFLEGVYPLFKFEYKKWKHAKTNFVLLFTTILINVVFGIATASIFIWGQENSFGLLHWIDLPLWIEMIIGIMLLDLIAQYFVHYLLHRIGFMWRFHMVHHSDTHVDVTTGTRHHPGDYIFRETFALLAVVIGGMPLAFYMIYRILTVLFTYLTHANLTVPTWLDRTLSILFISPHMHKFHHHFERPWTDTNFGNIFSIWDRLFGTFVYDDPRKIKYGLDVLQAEKSDDLKYQLGVPFDYSIKTDYSKKKNSG